MEEQLPTLATRPKKESTIPTCHIRLNFTPLTNVSIFELVEVDLQMVAKTSDGEETDLRKSQYATSDFSTFLNVLKSSLGSGLLAMPSAFMNAGLVVGCIGTVLVGFICAHCTYILVKTSQRLCFKLKKSHLNYPETTEAAFQYALKGKFKKYADVARQITNTCILLPHYGVGVIYVLLVAATLKQVFENYSCYNMDIRFYILLIAVPLLPVGTIRQMKYMVPFSAVANLFLLLGMALTLYYTLMDLPPLSSRPLVVNLSKIPLFLSTLLFGMEGIGVILPIENAMKNPKHFLGATGVLSCAMTFVVLLSLTMGFFGFVKYGDEVKSSITLNLPDTPLAQVVKLLVGVAILCTYGLQTMAAAQVIWNGVHSHVSKENQDTAYYIMRVMMVLGHISIAILVPKLGPVISLIGAFGLTTLGLALPALLETLTFWEDGMGVCHWRLWKNVFLWLSSVVILISGTWVSCLEIIDTYS